MKNFKLLSITALLITILLSGCNNSKEEEKGVQENIEGAIKEKSSVQTKHEVPEPYIKAITAINNQNWKLANTYLDLVLSDFPKSEYVFPTQILKGSMKVSEYLGTRDLLSSLNKGIESESPFYTEEDIERLRNHINGMKDYLSKSHTEQDEIFKYIAKTFKTDKDYTKYYIDIKTFPEDNSYSNNLSFFEDVGYPLPTESEIEEFLDTKYSINVPTIFNQISYKPDQLNYNYLLLLYNAGMIAQEYNQTLSIDLFNLILDITSEDIYNEYRISVEKFIGDANNENNQNEELNQTHNNIQENSNTEKYDPFEWDIEIKGEFENQMVQNGYVDSKENLIYKDGYIGGDNQGYYSVYTIDENGEERYIVVVNVKTGSYHG